jgi:hypothetical protein
MEEFKALKENLKEILKRVKFIADIFRKKP